MNEKFFYFARGRMFFLSFLTLGLAVLFGGISINIAFNTLEQDMIAFIVFVLTAIILLPVGIFIMKKALKKEPAVIINSQGITIMAFYPAVGYIPWEEIDGIIPYEVKGQPMIGFILHDEDKYLNKFSGVKKKLFLANRRMGFPAFNVPINNLKDKTGFLEALEENNVGVYIRDDGSEQKEA
ncbi:STM3941 family protein [Bacillus kwashiorkori]|uniref:STM3941 family protein n=1 Tax=Bacillus kwashiorkori TaxID=1522318 RepID=UPI001319CE3F|nr:STM3941 family protein [Bacillus kwashiorkori]